jgi:hypothetical protein
VGKTIAEKILSNKSKRDARANDIVIADLDFTMGQDGTSGLAIQAFNEMKANKVFDPNSRAISIFIRSFSVKGFFFLLLFFITTPPSKISNSNFPRRYGALF